jgi:hypothetical protein
MNLLISLLFIYIILNVYVSIKINKAYYLSEEMRKLHLKLIWAIPFIGPLMLRNFWKNEKVNKFPTNTRSQREKNNKSGDFYESGKGMDF